MSNAFICDICNNYYKNNDHRKVEGCIVDHKKRERAIELFINNRVKQDNNYRYYTEIDHFCRDCLLKLLVSAYPELKFFSITNAEEKNK